MLKYTVSVDNIFVTLNQMQGDGVQFYLISIVRISPPPPPHFFKGSLIKD